MASSAERNFRFLRTTNLYFVLLNTVFSITGMDYVYVCVCVCLSSLDLIYKWQEEWRLYPRLLICLLFSELEVMVHLFCYIYHDYISPSCMHIPPCSRELYGGGIMSYVLP